MLVMPKADTCARIFGVDPGTDRLGTALLTVDLVTGRIRIAKAKTLGASKAPSRYPVVAEYHGDRIAKHHFLRDELYSMFVEDEPHWVISESPFMGKFAQAFESLVQVVYNLRLALFEYDPIAPLHVIDPPSVKLAVGARGRSDKDVMKVAVMKLDVECDIVLSDLDEHAIDAIAVAYSLAKKISAGVPRNED